MTDQLLTVYGAHWCPDCRRSKQFLGEHQIPYNWVDIELDPKSEQMIQALNDGKRKIPTIVFPDGRFVTEPSNAELAALLGLKTTAARAHYDAIVIGGGPAGLTAALYLAREGYDALIIERAAFGGQAAGTEKLDNMPGFPDGVSGGEFSQRLRQQAERFGVELLQAQDVTHIDRQDNYLIVTTGDGSVYTANTLLLSTGSRYKRLGVPGEERYIGAGVHFCATCDGPFYKGKHVAVVGGGNSAAEESLHLLKYADRVTMLVRRNELTASWVIQEKVLESPRIDVRWHTRVKEFLGAKSKHTGVVLEDARTGEQEKMSIDGAFIFIGQTPNTSFLPDAIVTNDWGFVVTGHDLVHDGARYPGFGDREPGILETSVPGVFAAGDVRAGSTKQVASATGEGATAALLMREHLKLAT